MLTNGLYSLFSRMAASHRAAAPHVRAVLTTSGCVLAGSSIRLRSEAQQSAATRL